MNKIKPIHVMNEPGLSDLEKKAVLDGAGELLRIGEVENLLAIKDFGVWRNEGYRNMDGSLKEYQSVDWYLQEGRKASHNKTQIKADKILDSFKAEPWQKGSQEHYDILITHSDIYSEGINFVIGLACHNLGTVISTHRFEELDDWLKYKCVKTETMHELGHVFHLPAEEICSLNRLLAGHCPNKCVMRQGTSVPEGWINMTKDRLEHGPLCKPCETYLKNYFK